MFCEESASPPLLCKRSTPSWPKGKGKGKGKLGKGKGKDKYGQKGVYGVYAGDEAQWYPAWPEERRTGKADHAGVVYYEDDEMIAAF